MTSRRSGILWGAFALALVLAMWGWLWVVQRVLKNESDAGAARVMEAEERYLHAVAPGVRERILSEMDAVAAAVGTGGSVEELIPGLVRRGVMSGVWMAPDGPPTGDAEDPVNERVLEDWRNRVRAGTVSPEELASAFEKGELRWGWVREGRDVVAGLALSLMRQHPGNGTLRNMLRERVWDYGGAPLRPAFRLLIIRGLLEQGEDPELGRLQLAEELRLAWGSRGNVGDLGDYEVVRSSWQGVPLRFFWTRERLQNVASRGLQEQLAFRAEQGIGLAGVRLDELERWPVMGLRDRGRLRPTSADANETALIWVGATSGLLVLALAVGSALVAGREYKLARMRTDLAASVAHELRTPLAGQRLLLESLVQRDDMPDGERNEYVQMALRENLRLGRLAEEFLTFSRLERGVLSLEEEIVAVKPVLNEAVESLREKWSAPGCRLSVDVPDGLPSVIADGQALVTVVRNLLENAWKYSGDEKEITVTAGDDAEGVWIAVRDNGVGVAPGDRERVFRQFYRVDQRLARDQDGLGIGLSIVRRLMTAMRGRVTLESHVGSGSEFKLWLPKES